MTTGDLITEVLVRMGTDTTTAYYTDAILERWVDKAHRWALSYKRFPFAEARVTTTYVSGVERWDYPEGWRSDSIRILQVGSDTNYRLRKLNFEDYQIFREEEPSSSERVFSDFDREYYVNPNLDLAGTMTVYGQYTPAVLTGDTLFSFREEEGNDAIIYEMMSYAKFREKNVTEGNAFHAKAMEILEGIWKRIADEQYGYHTTNRGMFDRFDVLEGAVEDELLRRDQF